jgi:hypothetical protein
VSFYLRKSVICFLLFFIFFLSIALPLLADEEGEKESNSEALFRVGQWEFGA